MADTDSTKLGGVFLIVLAAGCGYLLITLPPHVIDSYDKAAKHGVFWAYLYLAAVTLGALIVGSVAGRVGYRLWQNTRRRRAQVAQATKLPSQMTRHEKDAAISSNLRQAAWLAQDLAVAGQNHGAINGAVGVLEHKRQSQTLEIVAFGTISSGKSSLLNALAGRAIFQTHAKGGTTMYRHEVPWPGADHVVLVDTPGLDEINAPQHEVTARQAAQDADLVLLVLDGPLRESECSTLKLMSQMEKRVLICLNKADWYEGRDRDELVAQIALQAKPFVDPEDVVVVQASPVERPRIYVGPDGTQGQPQACQIQPDISNLGRRMLATIKQDGRDLLLANLLLRSRALVQDAKRQVQNALDQRAERIVNQYMWRAGAVSAVVPFPAVDVAAGLTISTKMVFELAKVYRQSIDLKLAERLLGQMGKNLVGILGSHAVTPAVSTMMASALKTVPGIGTMTGGLLQGLTQAVVTRWVGQVFIEYFRDQMQTPAGGLAHLARRKWDQLAQPAEIVKIAKAGLATWRQENKPSDDVATPGEDQ